jgi:RNA polymerase sigma-70 factor (ECF subfamily)
MIDDQKYLNLVGLAQQGRADSMDKLVRAVQPKVRAYIYRVTLDHDLSQDLSQDVLMQMMKSLENLREIKSFWPWLFRIAQSKIRQYYREKEKKATFSESAFYDDFLSNRATHPDDALRRLLKKELSKTVMLVVKEMTQQHRAVLSLRCFEQLSYADIGVAIQCSEVRARVLFFRAKQLLKRRLASRGISKASLLACLGLFGTLTSPADAATSTVTVNAASAKVGLTATVVGSAGTKLGITAITAAILTLAAVSGISVLNNNRSSLPQRTEVKSFHYVEQAWDETRRFNPNIASGLSLSKGAYEQWFFFPDGVDGPMFMMMQRWDSQEKNKLCGWLQNDKGNFYYHSGEKTIYLYNYHLPIRDLKTRRLPSDTAEFIGFLDQVEGEVSRVDYYRDEETGLLVGILDDRFYDARNYRTKIAFNTLQETSFDSFRYPWPSDAPVVDERDAMHKRGWTYFRISGQVNGEQVLGAGQVPFIYNASLEHSPWLKLNIGNRLEIIDASSGAHLAVPDGRVIAAYPAGSFFKGLAKPWMGMHTLDIIRRDAAEKRIRFTTRPFKDKVEVVLIQQSDDQKIHIIYVIDLDRDVVETINFLTDDGRAQQNKGVLNFTYLEEVQQSAHEFTEPEEIKVPRKTKQDSMGILWLTELAQGTLG